MSFNSKCGYCGHVEAAYSHHLNAQMVMALRQIVDFYEKEKRPCNLQKDLCLSKNQYNNFQKLQYFGLVARTKEGWWPELNGDGFIRGEKMCYDRVATFKKSVLGAESIFWKDVKEKPRLVRVWDIDVSSFKSREAYQQEKTSQLNLF